MYLNPDIYCTRGASLRDSFCTCLVPARTLTDYKTLLYPSIEATHTPPTMSNQTDHLSSATAASQDTSSSKHGPVASALISLFSPSGPSGDWLKLFVIGGILELLRRFSIFIWRSLVNQFWITIALEEYDDSYCESPDLSSCHLVTSLTNRDPVAWMMLWLSKQPTWTRAKELSISTYSFGVGGRAVLLEGEADSGNTQRKIGFLPSFDCSASLWYRGHYVRLSRSQVQDGPFYTKEILTIKLVILPSLRLSQMLTLGYQDPRPRSQGHQPTVTRCKECLESSEGGTRLHLLIQHQE